MLEIVELVERYFEAEEVGAIEQRLVGYLNLICVRAKIKHTLMLMKIGRYQRYRGRSCWLKLLTF